MDWAVNTSHAIQEHISLDEVNTIHLMSGVLSGKKDSWLSHTDESYPEMDIKDAYLYLLKMEKSDVSAQILEFIKKAGFSRAFELNVGALIASVSKGSERLQKAFNELSLQDRRFITDNPERFFFPDKSHFNFLTAPVHTQTRIVSITRKIDFAEMVRAGKVVVEAVDDFTRYCMNTKKNHGIEHFFTDDLAKKGLLLDLPSPIGRIVIFGSGNDVFEEEGAIIIDLGGDDRWIRKTVSGDGVPGKVSLIIDVEGNDTYGGKNISRSNGFGVLSIDIISDAGGDDRYFNRDMGQGCGLFGIGILKDLDGRDIYNMGLMGQGFGLFGFGVLIDKGGDDRYTMRGMGQGAGSTMGFGLLCDQQGNDKYLVDRNRNRSKLFADKWCHAQGAGLSIRSPDWKRQPSFYGGIGFLSDGGGDDTYYSSHGNTMGSSYFMSIGALVDHDGNDKYLPQNGYSIGFAVHLSNAVLADLQGDDYYYAKTHTGGVGSDRSMGILADYNGNDIYGPTHEHAQKTASNLIKEKNRQTHEMLKTDKIGMKLISSLDNGLYER